MTGLNPEPFRWLSESRDRGLKCSSKNKENPPETLDLETVNMLPKYPKLLPNSLQKTF